MPVTPDMCKYFYKQFASVSLELETVDIGISPEQIRLDAPKLGRFREKLFQLVKTKLSDDTVSFENARTVAKELQMTRQFQKVKSIQHIRFSESWWKKFVEKYKTEYKYKYNQKTTEAIVIENDEPEEGTSTTSIHVKMEEDPQEEPIIIQQAD